MESISDTNGIMELSIALLLWKRNGSNGQHKSGKTSEMKQERWSVSQNIAVFPT